MESFKGATQFFEASYFRSHMLTCSGCNPQLGKDMVRLYGWRKATNSHS